VKTATWVAIAALGTIPAALLGWSLSQAAPDDTAQAPTEVVEVQPEFPDLTLGRRPPGEWRWSELRGGECIDFFVSAWEETFQVVPCSSRHDAEFVRVGLISTDPDAVYPGDDAIAEFAREQCESWEPDDLINGEEFDDLVVSPSYSLGLSSWESGDRLAGCFVHQKRGGSFTQKLVH
jgi:hypothetical protein